MPYPEYDSNEASLGQTMADFLRGMSKKQSWQEVGQGIQNTAKVIPSVVESLGRGALVQLPALAGDVSQITRQFIPETMQNTFGNRTAPTSEEILAKVPRLNPDYQGSQQHEMVGGLISPAMPSLLRAGAKATQNMPIGNMIAYHGTPHEIKGAFDINKVGTGEGAQAYGHGMYFAENPEVANTYKKAFEQSAPTIKALEKFRDSAPLNSSEWQHYDNLMKRNRQGNLYKVDIPDAYIPTMMDYDKPLGQQSAIVKKALNDIRKQITPEMKMELGGDMNLLFGKDITPVQFLNTMEIIHPTGGVGIGEKMLNELGVKGMRYLDGTSRNQGKGTSNFVVFDPQEVKILEKNSKPVSRKEILEEQIKKINIEEIDAMKIAQKNAALPIKEGGLGLPKDNTAMDRAKAMGYETPVYHGTNADINAFNVKGKGKTSGAGAFFTTNPTAAETYVSASGQGNILPLLIKKDDFLTTNASGRNWADIYTNELSAKSGKSRYTPEELGLDRNSVTTTDELGMIASDMGKKGTFIKNVKDLGPNSHVMRAKEYLNEKYGIVPDETWSNVSSKQFDEAQKAMKKFYESQKSDVYAINEPSLIRSRFAAFDPKRINEANILAGGLAIPTSELTRREIIEQQFNKK